MQAAGWLAAILTGSGCAIEDVVSERVEELDKEFAKVPAYEAMPVCELSWEAALEKMLRENHELIRARNEIESAKNNCKSVWLNLVPLVNIGYFYNTALLGNSADYYGDESTYNLNIIFNIPALTRLPVDHYVAQLALFRAEKNLELKKRELASKLYKHAKEAALSEESFRDAKKYAKREQLEEIERKRAEELRTQWMECVNLLGDATTRFRITGEIPPIPFDDYLKRSRKIDPLVATLMAMELEASRLAQIGIKLNYWPTVTVNFYSPALFSYSGGNQEGFYGREKDLRMQLDFFVQLDTQLSTYFSLKEAEAAHELLEKTLKMQMIERREKIALILLSQEEYVRWKKTAKRYENFLERQNADSAESVLERRKNLRAFRETLTSRERENIEREAALILEYGIPGLEEEPQEE